STPPAPSPCQCRRPEQPQCDAYAPSTPLLGNRPHLTPHHRARQSAPAAAPGNRANRGKARGFAPGPHQGALPLGSPPRAEPLEPFSWLDEREGACAAAAFPTAGRKGCGGASPLPLIQPKRMDCKGSAFAGGPGGKAPGRVSGQSPDLPSFTRLPCGAARRPPRYGSARSSSRVAFVGFPRG